jgi:hypothetical protein
MPKFPEKPRSDHAPEGHVPNPRKRHSSEHSVGSSTSAGVGHNDSMNRMEHPFRISPPNDESGEGQG